MPLLAMAGSAQNAREARWCRAEGNPSGPPRLRFRYEMDGAAKVAAPPLYPESFTRAVARVLANEGGYENQAADRGGETRFGISHHDYPNVDLRSLTQEAAIAIYFRDFWSRAPFGGLPAPLAEKLFDLSVNMGTEHGVRCLQRALRATGNHVAEDGVLGDATLAAARAADAAALLAALRSEAAGYYRMTAAQPRAGQSGERSFLEGWLNRAYE